MKHAYFCSVCSQLNWEYPRLFLNGNPFARELLETELAAIVTDSAELRGQGSIIYHSRQNGSVNLLLLILGIWRGRRDSKRATGHIKSCIIE